jgi:hypothetical protein
MATPLAGILINLILIRYRTTLYEFELNNINIMNKSRRKTLALIGGGFIAAAGIGTTAFVTTRRPNTALAPWQNAGSYDDPRKNALSYAILAPNPHNLQPWMVDLTGTDTVALYRDPERNLPHTDPFSRQITIGLGCFLEQMKIAATQTGHDVGLELFPAGENGPVAIARFSTSATPDPLAAQLLDRRSCKEPYQMTAIDASRLSALETYADIVTESEMVEKLQSLTWEAFQIEMATPRMLRESAELMRIGKQEINASPDGIDIGGPMLETLMLLGILPREALMDPDSEATQSFLSSYKNMLMSTPAYAVITSAKNDRLSQVAAGAAWLRLNLKTTELGLALHPVSQALQEYDEMAKLYDRSHELLAKDGETVQMLGRLGYGPLTKPAPRWPLEAKLLNG